MKIPFLKFIHSGLLTGMPSVIYNPITKNPLNIPLTIEPDSIYLNFKLSTEYSNYLDKYIEKFNGNLSTVPVCLFPEEEASKYLSINIYNCSSPAFLNGNKQTLRCELNTYIKDNLTGKYGTLILDYLSNELSMDPVNLFRFPPTRSDGAVVYNVIHENPYHPHSPYFLNHPMNKKTNDIYQTKNIYIDCRSKKDNIKLTFKMNVDKIKEITVTTSKELVFFSDYIYYKNGIYDKLYYDDTLVNAKIKSPNSIEDVEILFVYKDLFFEKIDSIFYFQNKINFVGSMWENIDEYPNLL
jgi:hypothetical protein